MFEMKEVKIKPASNGFIVNVGCRIFVVESTKKLLKDLERYIKYPNKTEKSYETSAINKELCVVTSTGTCEGSAATAGTAMRR